MHNVKRLKTAYSICRYSLCYGIIDDICFFSFCVSKIKIKKKKEIRMLSLIKKKKMITFIFP